MMTYRSDQRSDRLRWLVWACVVMNGRMWAERLAVFLWPQGGTPGFGLFQTNGSSERKAMPRIRTIKPDFWCSEQIVECSPAARLMFIGLWNFADDQGVHPASTKRLKMQVFPGDAFTDGEVNAMVQELIDAGLLGEFQAEGRAWWFVTGWNHQKIDKPSCKYPPPPKDHRDHQKDHRDHRDHRTIADNSPNDRRTIAEPSPNDQQPIADRSTREKEKEKDGEKEGKGKTQATAVATRRKAVSVEGLEWPAGFGEAEIQAMQEWLDHKRSIGKAYVKASAVQNLLKRFEGRPGDFVKAVQWSIGQNYQGLFEERNASDGNRATRKTGSGQQFDEAAKGTW